MRKNKKGFTLIELLAVIVILGLLMAIAIPSVTKYITQSRKKTLVNSIDSFITAASTAVNDNEFGALSNQDIIYYIPVSNISTNSCISLEKGGTNPFGNWMEAYVAVNYDAEKYSYDYFFTFYDDAGYGMRLIKSDDIKPSGDGQIINPTPVDGSNITTQLGGRANEAKVLSSGSCDVNNSVSGGSGAGGSGGAQPTAICQALSGTGNAKGDKISCGGEKFYIISNDGTNIKMLPEYNIDASSNRQSATASTEVFSYSIHDDYPWEFVYKSGIRSYEVVENYISYLRNNVGITSISGRLGNFEDLYSIGCSKTSCSSAPSWAYSTNYWTGMSDDYNTIIYVYSNGSVYNNGYYDNPSTNGIRPFITMASSNLG